MTNYRQSLAAILCFTAAACADDGTNPVVPTEDAAVGAPSGTAADPSMSPASSATDETLPSREGPWGCYLADHHRCDCSIESAADCDGVGLWVEGCSTCTPRVEDAGAPRVEDARAPRVDGGVVVDASTPPAAVDAAAPDSSTTSSAPSRTSEPASSTVADAASGWGCYAPSRHQCDCASDPEQCSADDGIWTPECGCSALDASQ